MNDKTKNILTSVLLVTVTAAITFFGKDYLQPVEENFVRDSTITITEKENILQNEFRALLKSKLKTQLIDSLKGILKPELKIVYESVNYNLDSLIAAAKREALASVEDKSAKLIFTSTADTFYVTKDSSGRTRDSLSVRSEINSPIPLHSAAQHFISMQHTSFDYDKETRKEVNTTKTITKKSLWSNVQPGLMCAYGYGLKSARWDFFVGAGANVDIQGLIKTLQGE